MATLDRYNSVTALLKQARRPAAEITRASLEENLQWLVQMAIPEEQASATLQQRIGALVAMRKFWRHWWPLRPRRAAPSRPVISFPDRSIGATRESRFTASEQQFLGLLLAADVRQLPDDPRLQEEARAMMRQLLERLPEPQREALVLQVLHGLSVAEIAQVLGQSEAQTGAWLQQARAMVFRHGCLPFEA